MGRGKEGRIGGNTGRRKGKHSGGRPRKKEGGKAG